jgi:hypothetical protein
VPTNCECLNVEVVALGGTGREGGIGGHRWIQLVT